MVVIKVSSHLRRGRRIRTFMGFLLRDYFGESVAYLKGDGSYIVRPVGYYLRWGEDSVRERLGRFFTTKG